MTSPAVPADSSVVPAVGSDIAAEKREMRAVVIRRRRAFADRPRASKIISDNIAALPEFQNANTIAAFAPMREEVNIFPLLQLALDARKKLLLPRVAHFKNGTLHFHQIPNLQCLVPSRLGIPEPPLPPTPPSPPTHLSRSGQPNPGTVSPGTDSVASDSGTVPPGTNPVASVPETIPAHFPPRADPCSADLLLVPAVAVDHQNFRLGYGGGFYDRLLAALPPNAKTCCPVFALQREKKIPKAPHDRPIWRIITEAD